MKQVTVIKGKEVRTIYENELPYYVNIGYKVHSTKKPIEAKKTDK